MRHLGNRMAAKVHHERTVLARDTDIVAALWHPLHNALQRAILMALACQQNSARYWNCELGTMSLMYIGCLYHNNITA